MINTINTAVIGCDMSEEFFKTSLKNRVEKFNWKKILVGEPVTDDIRKGFPGAEIVSSVDAIVADEDITLVLVSAKNLVNIRAVLEAGKSVRIIQ